MALGNITLFGLTMTVQQVENLDSVEFVRPELITMLEQYQRISDCLDGEDAVRARGSDYLPEVNPYDKSKDNKQRNADYLDRAVFYNFTSRTHEALVGAVFLKPPVVEAPELLQPMIANADGDNLTLQQISKQAVHHVLAYGRGGILTDFPQMDRAATQQEVADGAVRPTISFYAPWNIINWRKDKNPTKAEAKYTLIVLREFYDTDDDEFETEFRIQYRELRLTENGVYSQIWRQKNDETETLHGDYVQFGEPVFYKGGDGKPLMEIPFDFVGAVNNDERFDDAPMNDLAVLNIGHWRNSADHEESVFLMGQPTLFVSGVTNDWQTNHLKGGIRMGSREGHTLNVGADAKMVEASPNQLAFEAMKHKEDQAKKIGAKLLEQRNIEKTATEALIDSASESSVLNDVVVNVNKVMLRSLHRAAMFLNLNIPDESDEIKFELNDNFDLTGLEPEELRWLIELDKEGMIARRETRNALRRSGTATLPFEEYQAEVRTDKGFKAELLPDHLNPIKVAEATKPAENNNPEGRNQN